jgi:DNA polymerase-3 subunit epsilon
LPADRTPWREVTYSVVDLELTGLDPATDEIISFASVTVADGKVRLEDTRHGLVRPNRMPDADTIRIHGLRDADLEHAPPLAQVLDELLEALTGRALVAHVARIEAGFLGAALEAHGLNLRNPVIDTAALAVELGRLQRRPSRPEGDDATAEVADSSPGLGGLARSLGLPVHRPHHADGDALTTAQVFLALATHLDGLSPQTLGSLAHASQPPRMRPSLRSVLSRFGIERFRP